MTEKSQVSPQRFLSSATLRLTMTVKVSRDHPGVRDQSRMVSNLSSGPLLLIC